MCNVQGEAILLASADFAVSQGYFTRSIEGPRSSFAHTRTSACRRRHVNIRVTAGEIGGLSWARPNNPKPSTLNRLAGLQKFGA